MTENQRAWAVLITAAAACALIGAAAGIYIEQILNH